LADPAAEHEEGVAQAVDIPERPLADGLDARERQELALYAAAHGASLMQEALYPPAARQDERLERREGLLAAVPGGLELLHLALAHAEHPLVDRLGRRRELAPEVEQLVLDLPEDLVEPAVPLALADALRVEHPGQADDGVQLVDRAIGDDA